jgi:hypothetical protein
MSKPRTSPAKPPDWDLLHKYKHPGNVTVKCTFFWASNTTNDNARGYADKAETMLKEHNLKLDVLPARAKTPSSTLDFQERIYLTDHAEQLRNLAHQKLVANGRLPVIFCRFLRGVGGDSDVRGYAEKSLPNWLPFVLINVDETAPDNVTLLHEIGHAGGLGHIPSNPSDAVFNFMSYAPNRDDMLRNQVISIAKAYFSA